MEKLLIKDVCPDCRGERLRKESREVVVAGKTITELSHLPFTKLAEWLEGLPEVVSSEGWIITEPIIVDLDERIRRLNDVGAGYLSMDRSSPSLSGGEAQRLRLASLVYPGAWHEN